MHGFHIERRSLPADSGLSHDLAQHIFIRGARGMVVVTTDRPRDLLSTTKKQWNALLRLVQRERSSTLRAARIAELSNQISWMQHLRFTSAALGEAPDTGVLFASPESMLTTPPICTTLYITCQLTPEQFHMLTSWMPREGVVVVYDNTNS